MRIPQAKINFSDGYETGDQNKLLLINSFQKWLVWMVGWHRILHKFELVKCRFEEMSLFLEEQEGYSIYFSYISVY